MSVRSAGQLSFVDALAPQLACGSGRLDRIAGLVKRYRFEKLLVSCVTMVRGGLPGRRC